MFGGMNAKLTHQQLQALANSSDARILSIELNKPKAFPALLNSTATMNIKTAWNMGAKGAGQSIIILDTGVEASHPFFRDKNGKSRIISEGCYGTTGISEGTSYESLCPNKDINGDSPFGTPGAAKPAYYCGSTGSNCAHGTHVAGIAAGANGQGGIQGVAPEANIIAVNVYSFDKNRQKTPVIFDADLALVMQQIANAISTGTLGNGFVINISSSKAIYGSPCPNISNQFTAAVRTLKNLGIPVIASTGNDNNTNNIGWPACVPGVIKVSSVKNTGDGNVRSSMANYARPSSFPGEYLWFAPGGDAFSSNGRTGNDRVMSSGLNGTYIGMAGTSMAAPLVSGVYSLLKQVAPSYSVDGISEWIRANATAPVKFCDFCAPDTNYKRIRLP